jgi:hypothetical protein
LIALSLRKFCLDSGLAQAGRNEPIHRRYDDKMSSAEVKSFQLRQNVFIEFGSTNAAQVLAGIVNRSEGWLRRHCTVIFCFHPRLSVGGCWRRKTGQQ